MRWKLNRSADERFQFVSGKRKQWTWKLCSSIHERNSFTHFRVYPIMSLNEKKETVSDSGSEIVPYSSYDQAGTDQLSAHPRQDINVITAEPSPHENENGSRFSTYSLEAGHDNSDSFNKYLENRDDSNERDILQATMLGKRPSDPTLPRPDEMNKFGRPPADNPDSPPPNSQSSPAMLFGTMIVIGALAANVFGFRKSRWAVGKDVHRAWQNYERAAAERQKFSEQQAAASRRARQEQFREQQQQQRQRRQHERTAYNRAGRDAQEEFRRAQAARSRADREARSNTQKQHESWERTFRGPDGTYYETNYRVDFDPQVFEDLFGGQRRSRNSSNARNPFGMPEEVLQEFLRAAQQQASNMNQSRRTSDGRGRPLNDDFDPFRFWERMNNTGGFDANFDPGANNRTSNNPFGRIGMARYYSVLGLKQGASDAEIKAAYRKEVMKWHPDRYRGSNKEEAEKKFREVTDAYNALTGK